MEDKIKVSVILPVHNVAEYLRQTLDDVCGQTLRQIEILCVNDGSTDASEQIIREYMEKDERIRLFVQENLFAGAARNRGIEEARGEYLICWDADDRFDRRALEAMYEKAVKDDADLCVCNAQRYDTKTGEYVSADSYLVQEFLPETMPFSVETQPQYIFNFATNVPWNKLYRRSFVMKHGLRYETRERANDVYFNMVARYLARRITVVNEVLVAYRINNTSSLTGTLSKTPLCAAEAFAASHETLKQLGAFQNPKVRQSFANRVLYSLLFALHKQTDAESFLALYEYMSKGGLEKLEVTDGGEGYYYKERVYELYLRMTRLSAMDYIMTRDAELLENKEEANRRLRRRLRRITSSKGYPLVAVCLKLEDKIKDRKKSVKQEK